MNKTFYNVVNFIQEICESHPQIKNFYYGDKVQIDSDSINNFPLVICNPLPSTSNNNTFTFSIELVILDLSKVDYSDQLQIQSKTFDLAQDILGEIKLGAKFALAKEYTFVIPEEIGVNPIQPNPDFNDRAFGCSIDLNVEVTYEKNGCPNNIFKPQYGAFSAAFSNAFN